MNTPQVNALIKGVWNKRAHKNMDGNYCIDIRKFRLKCRDALLAYKDIAKEHGLIVDVSVGKAVMKRSEEIALCAVVHEWCRANNVAIDTVETLSGDVRMYVMYEK